MNTLVLPKITISDDIGNHASFSNVKFLGVLNGKTMIFGPQEWAPGVFAGMEGATVLVDGKKKVIKSIDLKNRIIKFK